APARCAPRAARRRGAKRRRPRGSQGRDQRPGTAPSRARSRTAPAAAAGPLGESAEVRQRLVVHTPLVEVACEAARGEDAVGGERGAVVRVAVAGVDDLTGRQVAPLARLAALRAGLEVAEADVPAVGPRVDAVRPQLDLAGHALALEHRLDQLVEARRDDEWVLRPRE